MFKLQPNSTFRTKVGIVLPGQQKPAEIEVEFKFLSRSAAQAFFDGLRAQTEEVRDEDGNVTGIRTVREAKKDSEALAEIMVGWNGPDQDYSAESLALLIDNYPTAAFYLFDAFRSELLEAKRKN